MEQVFNIVRKDNKTILKTGRKIYAEITQNKNPEYNWMVWFKTGVALSGYESEQKAIERAERMYFGLRDIATQILSNFKK